VSYVAVQYRVNPSICQESRRKATIWIRGVVQTGGAFAQDSLRI